MGITVREVEVEAGHLVVQTADHRAHRSTGAPFDASGQTHNSSVFLSS
jgi:hypothetical protein